MGMFGWSLPPGCSLRDLPGEQDFPCDVCGEFEDKCICPECPVCGDFGNPDCYDKLGHLVRTQEQIDRLAANEKRWKEECEGEAEFWASQSKLNHHIDE